MCLVWYTFRMDYDNTTLDAIINNLDLDKTKELRKHAISKTLKNVGQTKLIVHTNIGAVYEEHMEGYWMYVEALEDNPFYIKTSESIAKEKIKNMLEYDYLDLKAVRLSVEVISRIQMRNLPLHRPPKHIVFN